VTEITQKTPAEEGGGGQPAGLFLRPEIESQVRQGRNYRYGSGRDNDIDLQLNKLVGDFGEPFFAWVQESDRRTSGGLLRAHFNGPTYPGAAE
jgi:hypothetical protein